jgi:hypothetical protein
MSVSILTLGPVVFDSFEIPENLSFGGRQRLVVHNLPGGVKIIDAMGRDDADLSWSGIFTGPQAADRARLLDLMRAEGGVLPLLWDSFCYSVIISRFSAEYRNPFWLPYRITCAVVRDEAQGLPVSIVEAGAAVLADVAAAASFGTDTTGLQTALNNGGAGIPVGGTALAQTQALAASQVASNQAAITATASSLPTTDLGAALQATGNLAALTAARGYLARAARNLSGQS